MDIESPEGTFEALRSASLTRVNAVADGSARRLWCRCLAFQTSPSGTSVWGRREPSTEVLGYNQSSPSGTGEKPKRPSAADAAAAQMSDQWPRKDLCFSALAGILPRTHGLKPCSKRAEACSVFQRATCPPPEDGGKQKHTSVLKHAE